MSGSGGNGVPSSRHLSGPPTPGLERGTGGKQIHADTAHTQATISRSLMVMLLAFDLVQQPTNHIGICFHTFAVNQLGIVRLQAVEQSPHFFRIVVVKV